MTEAITLNKPNIILALASFGGNVGKSTIAKHIKPMIPGAQCIAVEARNSAPAGYADEQLSAKQFADAMEQATKAMFDEKSLIIDIGSSSIEAMQVAVRACVGVLEDIDLWIIPTLVDDKAIPDTIKTANYLISTGVAPGSIAVVMNRVPIGDEGLEKTKATLVPLYKDADDKGYRVIKSPLYDYEIVSQLHNKPATVDSARKVTREWAMQNPQAFKTSDARAAAVVQGRAAKAVHHNLAEVLDEILEPLKVTGNE